MEEAKTKQQQNGDDSALFLQPFISKLGKKSKNLAPNLRAVFQWIILFVSSARG